MRTQEAACLPGLALMGARHCRQRCPFAPPRTHRRRRRAGHRPQRGAETRVRRLRLHPAVRRGHGVAERDRRGVHHTAQLCRVGALPRGRPRRREVRRRRATAAQWRPGCASVRLRAHFCSFGLAAATLHRIACCCCDARASDALFPPALACSSAAPPGIACSLKPEELRAERDARRQQAAEDADEAAAFDFSGEGL